MIPLLRRQVCLAAAAVALFSVAAAAAPSEADAAGSKASYQVDASGGTANAASPVGLATAAATNTRIPTPIGLPITPSPAPASANMGVSVVFYLLVLLLLAAVAIYVARSGWPSSLLRKNASRKLQVAEIRSLGNRQFLVVAEYETTRLLLGVSHGRIDLLCHLGRDALEGEDFAPLVREAPAGPRKENL